MLKFYSFEQCSKSSPIIPQSLPIILKKKKKKKKKKIDGNDSISRNNGVSLYLLVTL